jgi:hypothetical protein
VAGADRGGRGRRHRLVALLETLQLLFGGLQGRQLAGARRTSSEATNSASVGSSSDSMRSSTSPLKNTASLRCWACLSLALEGEHVVPAVGVEHAGEQGRAQDVAHLQRGMPGCRACACSRVTTLPWMMSMR